MENLLDEARKIINEVDAQMAELFVKRMRAAEMVYEHKRTMGLPILDQAREAVVIEQNTKSPYRDIERSLNAVSNIKTTTKE